MWNIVKGVVSRLAGWDLLHDIISRDDTEMYAQLRPKFASHWRTVSEFLPVLQKAKAHKICCEFLDYGRRFVLNIDDKDLVFVYESFIICNPRGIRYLNEMTGQILRVHPVLLTKGYIIPILTECHYSLSNIYYFLSIGQGMYFRHYFVDYHPQLVSLHLMLIIPRMLSECREPDMEKCQKLVDELLLYEGTSDDQIFIDGKDHLDQLSYANPKWIRRKHLDEGLTKHDIDEIYNLSLRKGRDDILMLMNELGIKPPNLIRLLPIARWYP
jgi:hypothetical protein